VIQAVCRAEAGRHVETSFAGSKDARAGGDLGGLSEAAVCFRMTASSAIRWRALERKQGNLKAKPVGGDRRSEPMERHGNAIRSLVDETPDLTLE
jgi:hypothetical protein